jgi:dienelactone hydrolase
VDKERDFIAKTLIATGQVAQTDYLLPRQPVTRAATAHGQAFQSDGRIVALLLRGADRDRSAQFAEIFCAVLARQRPDEGPWEACSEYLETKGRAAAQLGPLPTDYRVLVVPGVFNNCASDAPAFEQGRQYLNERGVLAELLAVPNDSSEGNGRRIAEYVKEQAGNDPRRFVLIGYSKGAPDAHEAVVNDPEAARHVAAFISVAGAVGGSPIADTLPAAAQRWMDKLKMQACAGDLNAAMRSLRRDVREAFQKAHARLPVPTYSFASVAEEGRVSRALMETWKLLLSYDRRQDAQLLLPDQIVPGSIYLGAARADHFAVALPFDLSKDEQVRRMADRNRFPRTALLEALLRYVALDLEARAAR